MCMFFIVAWKVMDMTFIRSGRLIIGERACIRRVYECLSKRWIRLCLIDAKAPTAHDRKGEEQSVLFAYYIVRCYIVHQLLIHI